MGEPALDMAPCGTTCPALPYDIIHWGGLPGPSLPLKCAPPNGCHQAALNPPPPQHVGGPQCAIGELPLRWPPMTPAACPDPTRHPPRMHLVHSIAKAESQESCTFSLEQSKMLGEPLFFTCLMVAVLSATSSGDITVWWFCPWRSTPASWRC
jgi:hypothetical protein